MSWIQRNCLLEYGRESTVCGVLVLEECMIAFCEIMIRCGKELCDFFGSWIVI